MHARRGKLQQGEETYGEAVMEQFFERNGCIWAYHAYKEVWEAAVGESLVCEREPENASDRYTVAVKKELSYDIYHERYRGRVRCSCDEEVL